jgi:hypothetical protein
MSSTTARNPFVNACPPGDAEDLDKMATFVQRVRHIREAFVAQIIAAGIVEGDDFVEAVVQVTGHEAFYHEHISALAKRVEEAGIDGRIPSPILDDVDSWFDDAMLSRAIEWGYAGYLLGLAVGMQLGPDAFNGGAR